MILPKWQPCKSGLSTWSFPHRMCLPGLLVGIFILGSFAPAGAVSPRVIAGGNHSGALKPDGSLWGWGTNNFGQLGEGTTTLYVTPTRIGTESSWVKIAKGEFHTMGIKGDGSLWAWGRNLEGEYGNGATVSSLTPVQVAAGIWTDVAAGGKHTLALKDDGTLWAWGDNTFGQLGVVPPGGRSLSPLRVGSLTDHWVAIAAGSNFSVAIKDTGGIFTWGKNFQGQLGNNSTIDSATPGPLALVNGWKKIAAGSAHVLAIDTSNNLWSWGQNLHGEVGIGNAAVEKVTIPQRISGDSWLTVAAGAAHSCAIRNDQSLWCWGYDGDGQLGDGLTSQVNSPVPIGSATNWIDVAAGLQHTLALDADNILWGWGSNVSGQVGSLAANALDPNPTPVSVIPDITDIIVSQVILDQVTSPTRIPFQSIGGTTDPDIVTVDITVSNAGGSTYGAANLAGGRWDFLVSPLTSGINSITVTATDAGSNTSTFAVSIVYDDQPPTVTLGAVQSPINPTVASQLISGTLADDVGVASVTISAPTVASVGTVELLENSWQCLLSGFSNGANGISVTATDLAGNQSAAATGTIELDAIPPAAPLVTGVSPSNSSTPTWTWESAGGGNLRFRLQLDDGSFGSETDLLAFTPTNALTEGSHSLLVQERDAAGNWSPSGSYSTLVDTLAPQIAISAPGAGSTVKASLLQYTVSDGSGSGVLPPDIDVLLDGSPSSLRSGDTLDLAEGPHTLRLVAVDQAGNANFSETTFTVDKTPPSLSVPGDMLWNDPSGSITLMDMVEAGATVEIRPASGLGGGMAALVWNIDTFWRYELGSLQQGSNPITVIATDEVGNVTEASFVVTYDTLPPAVSINPVISPTRLAQQVVGGDVEAGATVEVTAPAGVSVGTVTLGAGTWQCTLSNLGEGSNAIRVTATDAATNQALPQVAVIELDTLAPLAPVVSAPAFTNLVQPLFTWSPAAGSGGNGQYRYRLDNPDLATGAIQTSTLSFLPTTNLSLGSHILYVQERDLAGNWSLSGTATVVIDTALPAVSIDGVASPTPLAGQVLQGSVEAGALVKVTVAGVVVDAPAAVTGTSWSYALTLPSPGTYPVVVTATDVAGNVGTTSTQIVFDTTPPSLGPIALLTPTNQASQTLGGTVEAGATVKVSVAGVGADLSAIVAGTSWSLGVTLPSVGTYAVSVTATDPAGNAATVNGSIDYDTVAPPLTITALTSPTNKPNQTLGGTVEAGASVRLTVAGVVTNALASVSGGTWSYALVLPGPGNYSVTVTASDPAGNSTIALRTILYDSTSPTIALNPLASPTKLPGQSLGGTVEANAAVTVTVPGVVTDAAATVSGTLWSYDLLLPSPALYQVTITATDSAGNAGTVSSAIDFDQQPPVWSVVMPASPTNLADQTLTGTIESQGQVSVSASSATQVGPVSLAADGLSWSCPLVGLAQGLNPVTITAFDRAGNSASQTLSITYDSVSPLVTMAPVTSPSNLPAQDLNGTVEVGAVLTVTVDSAGTVTVPAVVGGSWTASVSGLSSGSNVVTVVATDGAGNMASTSQSIIFDNTPPVLLIAPPSTPTNVSSQQLTGTVEAGALVEVSLGGVTRPVSLNGTAWTSSLNGLAPGFNTITVTATDSAGNTSTLPATIEYDAIAPAVILDAVTSPTNAAGQTIGGTIEAGASVTVSVDTAAGVGPVSVSGSSWSCALSSLATGANLVTVTARDAAGNQAFVESSIYLDGTPPVEPIVSGFGRTNNVQPTWTWQSGGSGKGLFRFKLDDPSLQTGASQTTLTTYSPAAPLITGNHTLYVQEQDEAGNWSVSGFFTTIIDVNAPVLTLDPVISPTNLGNQVLSGFIETGSTLLAAVSPVGATIGPIAISGNTWTVDISNLSLGVNEFTLTATDVATNQAVQTTTIYFDNIPPSVPVVSGVPVTRNNKPLWKWLSGGGSGNGVFRIKLDDPDLSSGATETSAFSFTPGVVLADGGHVLYVQETDLVGNWSPNGSFALTIDTSAPVVTLTPVSSPSNSASQTLSGTVEAGATVTVTLDTAATVGIVNVSGSSWSCALSNLVPGANRISVRAVDAAGNAATVVSLIELDVTPPVNPVVTGPGISGNSLPTWIWDGGGGGNGTFRYRLDDSNFGAGAVVTSAKSFVPTSLLSDLAHTLYVEEQDSAGNWSGPGFFTIVVDTTAPSLAVDGWISPVNADVQTLSGSREAQAVISVLSAGGARSWVVETPTETTWRCTVRGLEVGDNLIQVSASDAVGNVSAAVDVHVVYDAEPPALTVDPIQTPSLTDGFTVAGQREAGLEVSLVADYPVTIIGPTYPTADTWRYDLSGLTEGAPVAVTVSSIDAAGNRAQFVLTLLLDQTPPAAPVVSGTALTNNPLPSWTLLSGESAGMGTFRYKLDDPALDSGAVEISGLTITALTALADGPHTLYVQERDAAGNWSSSTSFSTTVDTVGPTVSITQLITPAKSSSQILGGAIEVGAKVSLTSTSGALFQQPVYSADGSSWQCTVGNLVEGTNTLALTATDLAGNPTTSFQVIVADFTPPAAPNVKAETPTRSVRPTWTWTAGGGGNGVYRYKLNNADLESGAQETPGLAFTPGTDLLEGENILYVQERDGAGNWSASGSQAIVIDMTAPTVTVDQKLYSVNTQTVVITGDRSPDSTVFLSLLPGSAASVEPVIYSSDTRWAVTINGLTEGLHYPTVYAEDLVWNRSPEVADLMLNVDWHAPELALLAPQDGGIYSGPMTLVFTNNEVAAPVQVLVDGVMANKASGDQLDLADGFHTLTLSATDDAGNSSSLAVTFQVDSQAPLLSLNGSLFLSNVTSYALTGDTEANATIEVSLDTAATAEVTYPAGGKWMCVLSGLVAGANAVTITATDAAGNAARVVGEVFVASLAVQRTTLDGQWNSLSVAEPYRDPVVIVGPATRVDESSGVARVRNVTPGGFDLQFANWSASSVNHGSEEASYLVAEAGRFTMVDGTVWEVGTFSLPKNFDFVAQTFSSPFAGTPTVYLTVQTANETDPVATRMTNLTPAGFEVKLVAGEGVENPQTGAEKVGYLAIYAPQGSGTAEFGSSSQIYLVQNMAKDSTPFEALSSRLFLEEEQTGDAEMEHYQETIGILNLGPELFAQVSSHNDPDPVTVRRIDASTLSQPVEWGTLNLVSGEWLTIPLSGTFANPVVVAKAISGDGNSVRGYTEVRQVSAGSFQVRYSLWQGAASTTTKIFFLAADVGSHQLGGLPLEAGKVTCLGAWPGNGADVSLGTSLAEGTPAVFASPQGVTIGQPLYSRVENLRPGGFSLGAQGSASGPTDVCNGEEIGWIAIKVGVGETTEVPPRYLMAFRAQASSDPTAITFSDYFGDIIAPLISGDFVRRYPGYERSFGRVVFGRYYKNPDPVLVGDISSNSDPTPVQLYFRALSATSVELECRDEGLQTHALEDISLLLIE